MKNISLLGATGSVGQSTIDVIRRNLNAYRIHAVSAYQDIAGLEAICREFRPAYAVVAHTKHVSAFTHSIADLPTRVLSGAAGLNEIAVLDEVDIVLAAIVGAAGLASTMAAVTAGKKILLANKEALVISGQLFMDAVQTHGATLLPIDSEHNAIFQCLPLNYQQQPAAVKPDVRRIVLTASGGPFRTFSQEQLSDVTPEQACAHPNWSMGRKISVDSATMMNKGLELIEASWLFGLGAEDIDVVVHPQSIVHSWVEYVDGSTLAELGQADMRTPIAHALAWPERIDAGVQRLDLVAQRQLSFEAPNLAAFPALGLARRALQEGGAACVVLNAANELAVDAFLQRRLPFTAITQCVETALDLYADEALPTTLDSIMQLDHLVRETLLDKIQAPQ